MAEEMSSRYKYVKGLADSAQERATKAHKEALDAKPALGNDCGCLVTINGWTCPYHSKLNDFFYWIGHANAYRGIALQLDFMETAEMDEDEEFTCP